MVFSRKQFLCATLVLLLMLILPTPAFAAYAYDYGRTRDLYWASYCVDCANAAWSGLGASYSSYKGSSFTYSTFLNNCRYGDAVYAYTHGNPDAIADNAGYGIWRSDVTSYRQGDFKRLIFLDACKTADNSNWAAAWGIRTGDGNLHAYLGWRGYSYDSWPYAYYVQLFWSYVRNHFSINYAAWYAGQASGVKNYYIYGNGNWYYQ